jgi:hypothetical protein
VGPPDWRSAQLFKAEAPTRSTRRRASVASISVPAPTYCSGHIGMRQRVKTRWGVGLYQSGQACRATRRCFARRRGPRCRLGFLQVCFTRLPCTNNQSQQSVSGAAIARVLLVTCEEFCSLTEYTADGRTQSGCDAELTEMRQFGGAPAPVRYPAQLLGMLRQPAPRFGLSTAAPSKKRVQHKLALGEYYSAQGDRTHPVRKHGQDPGNR